jgi:hypothetical protein
MKTCLFITIILVLSVFMVSSCSKQKGANKSDGPRATDTTPIAKPNLGGEIQPLSGPLDEESVKRAHGFLPQYPGAELDKTKGHHMKNNQKETFNLVYYTNDSVQKVADFFKSKISSQYLTEHKSPDGDSWVHFEYKVEGVSQSGGIFLRKTEDNKTEIVYMIDVLPVAK